LGPFAILVEMPFLLAHAMHWFVWVLYAVPVLIVVAASIHSLIQQRREGDPLGQDLREPPLERR
jgi:hypothetical protein